MNCLTIEGYVPRIADAAVEQCLKVFGAVVIEGPKWCGKTTTARSHALSETSMANPAGDFRERAIARLEPSLALRGEKPRLLDEWQDVPKLWDAVRYECDQSGQKGLFILTGSSTPGKRRNNIEEDERPHHSGAGRIARVRMDTMTLQELSKSSGEVSLGGLFAGERFSALATMDLTSLAEAVVRGGWPETMDSSVEDAALLSREYLKAVVEEDIHEVDGIERDKDKARKLIVSLARNESTLATSKTILRDTADGGGMQALSYPTLKEYEDALRRIFFIRDIAAWDPAVRSPVRIRAASKHHLADPSLAAAALGMSVEGLLQDPKTFGLLFESLVAHDLLVYASAHGADVRHYRDDAGLEADFIVEKPDGEWIAVEAKLGLAQVEDAARSLKALEKRMSAAGQRSPAALLVVVGNGGVAHVREDGVQVAPLSTLGV